MLKCGKRENRFKILIWRRRMNKKKIIIHFLIATMMLLASGCGKSEKMILKNLAYDEGAKEARVYIKENEVFVPYL